MSTDAINLSKWKGAPTALRKLVEAYDDLRVPGPGGKPPSGYAKLAERAVTEPGVQEAARAGVVAGLGFGRLLLTLDLVERVTADKMVFEDDGGREPVAQPTGEARFRTEGLPLPFTHVDFPAADGLERVRAAGEQVGRAAEQMLLNGWRGRDGKELLVHGLTTFPHRTTVSLNGLTPAMSLLRARDLLYERRFYGPYALLCGPGWDPAQLAAARPEGVEHVVVSRALPPDRDLLLVQLTPDVVRLVLGGGPVVTNEGGGRRRLVVILVPQLRADWSDRAGVAHVTP